MLIDLFKVYFNLKLILFKVKIDFFKIKIETCPKNKKKMKVREVDTHANWTSPLLSQFESIMKKVIGSMIPFEPLTYLKVSGKSNWLKLKQLTNFNKRNKNMSFG